LGEISALGRAVLEKTALKSRGFLPLPVLTGARRAKLALRGLG
jgi:hypothetical protein